MKENLPLLPFLQLTPVTTLDKTKPRHIKPKIHQTSDKETHYTSKPRQVKPMISKTKTKKLTLKSGEEGNALFLIQTEYFYKIKFISFVKGSDWYLFVFSLWIL